MSIKASFLSGKNTTVTDSLFQWDYGQVLEIESTDLGTQIIEVHFACPNMSEAIVRSCSLTNGVGTVVIPDDCLEQTSTITAWVYEIVGTQGSTRKVISIPVTARKRPSVAREEIPNEISNRYTELITEVNKAVDDLENGNVVVKNAKQAASATRATTAGNSTTANHAIGADYAELAGVLTSAWNELGEVTASDGTVIATGLNLSAGTYLLSIANPIQGSICSVMLVVGNYAEHYSTKASLQCQAESGQTFLAEVYIQYLSNGNLVFKTDGGFEIPLIVSYKKIT